MPTLLIPSFERRLLQTVRDEVTAGPVHEWPEQSLQLCLEVLRKMRDNTAHMSRVLEETLAGGVEARSFARDHGAILPDARDHLAKLLELAERLSAAEDDASKRLRAELSSLATEVQSFVDLLAEALSRASEAPRGVDAGRVRAAEEAYAHGETKPFSRR